MRYKSRSGEILMQRMHQTPKEQPPRKLSGKRTDLDLAL